jgi:hypothetical protein
MDPTALTAVFAFLPEPYRSYAASAIGILGILSLLASVISASIKPPSINSAKWVQTVYRIVTWPALNLGWARNTVVPGMDPRVQQAAIEVARVVAKMPEMAPMPVAVPTMAAKP